MTYQKNNIPWNKDKKGLQIPWNKGPGKHYSKKSRNKMSKSWDYNKHFTPETRRKISLANKGQKRSEEFKKHASEVKIGINNPFYGKHLSENSKDKISKSLKGKYIGSKNWMFGKHFNHTQETKNKISKAHKGTFEERFGIKRAEEIKKKIKDNLPDLSGSKNPMFGKHHTKESIEKFKETRRRINWICPKYDTKIEIKLQGFLKQLNIEFLTHQYIKDIEHGYQCDIFISSINLVIEADGDYWHKYPEGKEIDHIRTQELKDKGYSILRLWGSEIKTLTLEQFKSFLDKSTSLSQTTQP